ncbi:unnamed protein product [Symbiodinium natans]|uniref:Uncharacterized protein n=1 Tax=Symbiodinium natans TaxID=878477 RepID=A0A812PFI8_9DINO|nr:unnamed protein product [Symbiodinium natans]
MRCHVAGKPCAALVALSLLPCTLSQSLPADVCWNDGFSAELCCDLRYGPNGNPACWAGELTFEGCCGDSSQSSDPQEAELPPPIDPPFDPQDLHAQIGIGLFISYEPGKDCWTGLGGYSSHAMCCDLTLSGYGMGSCWDGWRYTFDRCCFLGEAAAFQPPSKPHLRLPKSPVPPKPGRAGSRPAGMECWQNDFTFAYCCLHRGTDCWDEQFTRAACCEGIADPLEAWEVADASDPRVICLLITRNVALDLEQTPKHCPKDRFFLLASLGPPVIDEDWTGTPWFWKPWNIQAQNQESIRRLQPLRPSRTHFVGGLCVPAPCSLETTAAYLAPRVVPWWGAPRPEPRLLNETHFLLPPPLASRHKVYRMPRLNSTWSAWVAPRPADADVFAEQPGSWEFAILEHRQYFGVSISEILTVSLGMIAASAGFLIPREAAEYPSFLAPQFHVLRLGLSRGPRHLEVARLWLTAIVLFIHVIDHGPWLPVTQHTGGAWLLLLRSGLNRVNVGFVVLLVHLSISRRSLKQATSVSSWIKGMLYHILKRWLIISPVVSFWSFVFIHAPFRDVPMNNILKSQALFRYYSESRDQCEHPAHIISSTFMVHAPLLGGRSPCMNADIFESLFHVDIVVFGLLSALGRGRAAIAAHLLWVPSVILSYHTVPNSAFNGAGHHFTGLLPAALATLAISSWLSPCELPLFPRTLLPWRHALAVAASICIVATCLQDALTCGEFEWPLSCLKVAASFFKTLHQPNQEYVIPCHVYELVFVLGMVIHLKHGWLSLLPQRQEPWSLLRFVSRISPGLCASNLFVLHFAGAFVHDEPVELSVFVCFAYLMVTFVLSLLVSLVALFLVEGPFACMLSDGLPQDMSALPAAAAAA